MKCHNVFNILLLEPTTNDTYPSQNLQPLTPGEIDAEDEYFIEAILNCRIDR
jgi:hypothetical protein